MKPISRIDLGQDFSKNGAIVELEKKLNEIIDRLNHITTYGVKEPRFGLRREE